MNDCFFCGPTDNPLTEEDIWPKWVSKLLRGKYGSDHFIHVRSVGDDTKGLWKSPNLKVTTDTVCNKCNNEWLSVFENNVVKPVATPLIIGDSRVVIRPGDQWQLAAWAYKMAMLLELVSPEDPRRFFTREDRKNFRITRLPDEHVRVFLANYKYGQHPAHMHQPLHDMTRRDDQRGFRLKISTVTAGCLAMQVMSVRSQETSEFVYASEIEFEFLGKARHAILPIWPPSSEAIRWPPAETMSQQDIEDWTDMWEKAQGMHKM